MRLLHSLSDYFVLLFKVSNNMLLLMFLAKISIVSLDSSMHYHLNLSFYELFSNFSLIHWNATIFICDCFSFSSKLTLSRELTTANLISISTDTHTKQQQNRWSNWVNLIWSVTHWKCKNTLFWEVVDNCVSI